MVEYPALLLGVSFLQDAKAHHRRRLVKRGVEQLPGETRRGVYELHRKKGDYVLDDILAPNAVSVQVTEEEAAMGLFLEFSRINHDCQPNALYRFSPKTLALEVFPYRTIQPGEEITVSYTPISMPHNQRREYLRQVWGFDCSCSLCHSTDEAAISDSDHRRERVGELKQSVLQASSQQYFENALVMAQEWLEVGEREGVPPLLAEYYDIVARLSFDVGDLQDARRYALLAFDAWTKFGSVDDTDLEAAREYLRELNRLGRGVKLERQGVANMFKDAE
ncbi:hypothetical protein CONLIGDRAFT_654819 [Coniochaeta ligniaria NRRL 30616]|uniref:SET domain-containing protein n=1 Tax=Coniochaeta ligniaria NRRL 30616 TaxID=1408157 RepID=A0A1J7IM34_9PEZI|nr:hypothetical protein CONLIGDRAFT_654819 [Coniochaeta ligniaria NRRL 30616]